MALQPGTRWILATGCLIAGVYFRRDRAVNQPAPAFSLSETYGGRVDLSSYRGRPVVLVFWMTSCGICQRELPMLSRIAPEFRAKGIDVLAIHLGGKEDARDYMRSNQIRLTCLYDPEGAVANSYAVSGVPKLVLVGADGKIKRTHAGMASEELLREWLSTAAGV
jgi:peroxiredoxin